MLAYTFLGGLTSAIYNEVLQFFLIVMGFSPLAIMAVMKAGGWSGMSARLSTMTLPGGMNGDVMTHSWKYMAHTAQNPMGIEVFGLVVGLGFVLSFGYWCTDFLVIQRAMAANSMSAARRTPLIAALPKMMMPFIVIVPGIAALALSQMAVGYDLPLKDGGPDYDQVLTTLMAQVLSGRDAGRRTDRPDGVLHERHGGQRHRVQHRVHLRHLSELHPAGRSPTIIT